MDKFLETADKVKLTGEMSKPAAQYKPTDERESEGENKEVNHEDTNRITHE